MKISETQLGKKLNAKRRNAAQRGIEFTIDHKDLRALFQRNSGHCDYTGLPFVGGRCATIERIDDKKGYIPGNLCLTCQQANQMKDTLLDKTHIKAFRVRKDSLDILDALRTKLTPEYLDHLKLKYRADHHYNPGTDLYKDYFKDLTEETVASIMPEEITEQETEEMSEETKPAFKLPEDVRIARYYATLANAVQKEGMEFTISYAEFKGRLSRKTCSFSGKSLDSENKFVLVLDKKKPLTKSNVAIVDEKFGHKISELSQEMGLSVTEIAQMFKRLA